MTQQKSEDRDKPAGRRKPVVTGELETRAGGEAIPVDEVPKQLLLFPGSAEALPGRSGRGGAGRSRERLVTHVANTPGNRGPQATAVRMDEVRSRLEQAFSNVARNRGAPGPDGVTLTLMAMHRDEWLPALSSALASGSFLPGDIRRVWIKKTGGGQRGLGIPNVIDRVVQEAVRLVLEPLYEPTFHRSSHGFRPERSCQTAIAEAVKYLGEGYGWVADIDLDSFFDRVHRQRLMSRLAQRVHDKPLLELIGRMLEAKVVMPDGLVVPSEEGVPQGGPLSPLLSNIVLDELDAELARRGHRFVRYADDCNIYVRSERAGQRVMASIKRFIEGRLRLKVNEQKSAVARPEERHFLGFRLRQRPQDGTVEVLLSKRSRKRFGETLRRLVPRNFGNSLDACIRRLNEYLLGWIGFFGTCTAEQRTFRSMDAHIRRRLRALQLRHWKSKRTIAARLVKLGSRYHTAWGCVYGGRKSTWALSHTSAVDWALRNSYWEAKGLVSIEQRWVALQEHIHAPVQLMLALG